MVRVHLFTRPDRPGQIELKTFTTSPPVEILTSVGPDLFQDAYGALQLSGWCLTSPWEQVSEHEWVADMLPESRPS